MTNMTNFMRVRQFHEMFGVDFSKMSPADKRHSRQRLLNEEYHEADDALMAFGGDKKALAKELCDLLYVVYGTADAYDIPIDLVFRHVHASNLSKLDENGKAIVNADGKVMKGPNYRPPDLSFLDE